jgi:hypothetical protein
MFDHRIYVPVLLTKRGERSALRDLPPSIKDLITPLFVAAPIDWNFDKEEPAKTIDRHLESLGKDLAECWGTAPAFLDLVFIDPAERMHGGAHPLFWLVTEANKSGAALVPTVAPMRDPAYRQAAAACVARDGRGACIRLSPAEWPSSSGLAVLNALLAELGIDPEQADLVLDLGEEVVASPSLSLAAVRNEIAVLPYLGRWRSLTVAGAGFPKDLSGVGRGLSMIERVEWTLYEALLAGPAVPVVPRFGDYVVANPDPFMDVNPRLLSISAALRYTVTGAWLVAKGELFKGAGGSGLGGAALVPVAAAIAAHPAFAGRGHCEGDDWIAGGAGGTGGNPERWRRTATNHHLTHVAEAVARLP